MSATIQTIQRLASARLLSSSSLIVPHNVPAPSDQLTADLQSLAASAQRAAASVLCSSILAGHTSESDDFDDAAIWLGKGAYGTGNEQAVLNSLGIPGGRISSVELSSDTHIPKTVNSSTTTPELSALSAKLAELQDLHCFSVQPDNGGSQVIYSLIGKKANGWAGLVGIGIWSDN
ncbi:hypothetical protein R3P38DRAFT_3168917 [Favolaschia claudopus]|uniref:Uncharacterized protein n=1 Tax=Favolaschia claudopus TaxID=2862362 RepID=A0AAW0E1M3_9AGAR